MAKITVDDREWYPVYEIYPRGIEVDIPEEKLEYIKKLFLEFKGCQIYLKELFKNASEAAFEKRRDEFYELMS